MAMVHLHTHAGEQFGIRGLAVGDVVHGARRPLFAVGQFVNHQLEQFLRPIRHDVVGRQVPLAEEKLESLT